MLPDDHWWLMVSADSARTGSKWCDYGIINTSVLMMTGLLLRKQQSMAVARVLLMIQWKFY
jgi:hypothetical protein